MENITIKPGIYYLILQELVKDFKGEKMEMIDEIINLLLSFQMLKWRHIKVILPYLVKIMSKGKLHEYFKNKFYNIIKIDARMITDIINIYPPLLELYLNEYVILNENFTDYPKNKIIMNYQPLLEIIEKYLEENYGNDKLKKFLKTIPDTKYDIVIDGNNILLNKKGKLTNEGIENLKKICNIKHSYIVFIHPRNCKKIKEKLNGINYVKTLYNLNDDWFSLYYAIKNNSFIVSKDNFKDHIYEFDTKNNKNLLKIYLFNKKLSISKKYSIIKIKEKHLPIIIKENNYYLIPGNRNYLKIIF